MCFQCLFADAGSPGKYDSAVARGKRFLQTRMRVAEKHEGKERHDVAANKRKGKASQKIIIIFLQYLDITCPCFSKVPKLFGPISVASQFPLYLRNAEVQAIKLRNPLGFSYIRNILKDQLIKTSGLQFSNWLFGIFGKQTPG